MTLSVIFSAASLIICGFFFIWLLGYLRRRTSAERILKDFEEEVDRLIAGIDLAAERNLTLLEDKAKSIKALLETLDRRIAAYARELDRRNTQETVLDALARESGSVDLRATGAQTEDAYTALGRGRGLRSSLEVKLPEAGVPLPESPGPDIPAAPPPPVIDPMAAPSVPPVSEPEAGQSPRFIRSPSPIKTKTPLTERVLELSRNGFSAETIAARLGVTIAEVDLAMAMSERRNNGY
ncbi:MAG: hypothetical protein LBB68_10800 [Treponema sp.]|jgi:hypothetical protein|nr:hypothetical protein [Treponema sp.]